MPFIEDHEPGSFCWVELGSSDHEAAKTFYDGLFGWGFQDFPMGPAGVYTMFQYKGQTAAAAYTIGPQMVGVPPHWMLYIAVESADAAAAKCTEAGGKVTAGPFDVDTNGRMAVLQDPTGAMISVWEPKTTKGIGVASEPNTFCWADLSCPDQEKAVKFYSEVFGWTISGGDDGSGYLHIANKGKTIGGIPPSKHYDSKIPPHWLVYFNVDDVDKSANKVTELGGKVYMPPTDIPHVGRMATIADPQGAVCSLFKEAPRS